MAQQRTNDWDPASEAVARDQIQAYDELRKRCPVAHSEHLHWSLFRHAHVMRVLMDPAAFSSAVSAHLSVPSGMDPPVHTEYRRVIDPYFSTARLASFEPKCRRIAADLIGALPDGSEVEWMSGCAEPFALQSQCAFLDWPVELHAPLREWTRKNHEATRSRDRKAMEAVALEFDSHIRAVLDARRNANADPGSDVASRLLLEQVSGRRLTDEEIVSVLRNWTVGELATISACVGILAHYLAGHPDVQDQLRRRAVPLPAAIDEILRIRAPLMTSRRIAAADVEIGDRLIEAGERITLMWASANRDEAVFGDPDAFRIDRDPDQNLLYGAGIHVCPGAPLARMELRVFMEELLARTSDIRLSETRNPPNAVYPASGFSFLPLRVEKRLAVGG